VDETVTRSVRQVKAIPGSREISLCDDVREGVDGSHEDSTDSSF
jgi:hypothetical protein